MKCSKLQLILVATGFVARASAALSGWDEVKLQLLENYPVQLRWYNVEGRPYLLAGTTARHQWARHSDYVELSPGQEILLCMPPDVWLRIVRLSDAMTKNDLGVSVSTDGRTFVETCLIDTTDSRSWLVALPWDDPSIIRIAHRGQTNEPVKFELYFSCQWPLQNLLPYNAVVSLPARAIRLRASDEPFLQHAQLVKPQEGMELHVTGPTHLQFIVRVPLADAQLADHRLVILQLRLDDQAAVPMVLVPELEGERGMNLLRALGPISKRALGFVSIPEGKHQLHIKPSVPVYLSVYKQPTRQFLLPKLNAPKLPTMQITPLAQPPPLRDIAPAILSTPDRLSVLELLQLEQSAWFFSIDNTFRDAGGQAAELIKRVSQLRHDYPETRQTTARLWRNRTFYREVLPVCGSTGLHFERAFFVRQSLAPLFGEEQSVVVIDPTLEQVCSALADGHFAPVPIMQTNALIYILPPRSFDSKLCVAVLAVEPKPAHFFVQFDQAAPIRVDISGDQGRFGLELSASRVVAMLRALEHEAHISLRTQAAVPFGEFDLPMSVANPGVFELPLSKTVQVVRVYQEMPSPPLKVSVAYRAAKPFDLTEPDYLALLQQIGSDEALALFTNPMNVGGNATEQHKLISSHFMPLYRLLKAHYADFSKALEPIYTEHTSTEGLSEGDLFDLKTKAKEFEAQGLYIEAIGQWNRIFWSGTLPDRVDASLQIMRLLQLMGEEHLASQYARFALCIAPPQQLPDSAITYLAQNASLANDTEQLERLRGFIFMRCPCDRHLRELVEAFAANNKDEAVLTAGLLLPIDQRPVIPMLIAALHMNWWDTFDQLVESLPTAEEKRFWHAQKNLALFRFADAERELEQSGVLGQQMLRALRDGLRIRNQLGSNRFVDRLTALFEWEQWQATHPGPKMWVDAGNIVSESVGGELVFNCELNSYLQCYCAERDRPVKLNFLGPVRLRIEVRPIIKLPFDSALDDWVEITEYGVTHRVPVTGCAPNPALQLVSRSNAFAGMKTTVDLDFGPGLHELQVRLASNACLVRVLREHPALPLRVLPVLNTHHVKLLLKPDSKNSSAYQAGRIEQHEHVRILPVKLARPTFLRQTVSSDDLLNLDTIFGPELTPVERLRFLLRTDFCGKTTLGLDATVLHALPIAEQWLAVRRWNRFDLFTQWDALPEVEYANYLIATRQINKLLDSQTPRDILQRLNTLLQVSELFPSWRLQAQSIAELLVAEVGLKPGCKEFMDRMRKYTSWVPLPLTPQSAGLRAVQFQCDFPQHPASRLRHALLQPTGSDKITIGAESIFSASINLNRNVDLEVETELAKAGLMPLAPLTVVMELDGTEVCRLNLTPTERLLRTNLAVREGEHILRAWIDEPVVNHFVRIRLTERTVQSAGLTGVNSLVQAALEKRFFHLATTSQPVRFYWTGPALLRVDQWDNGRFGHQLRFLPEGEQLVEVYPPTGESEALYKFFLLAVRTNQSHAQPVVVMRTIEPIPAPQLELPVTGTPSHVHLNDYYPLGGQEDGTWTIGLMYARRRPFELDKKLDPVVNEFVQANAVYRQLSVDETLWSRTEALARLHTSGDITLGAEQRIERRPERSCMDLLWLGEAYFGTVGGGQQDLGATLYTEFEIGPRIKLTRKLECYPSAVLFARYMTLSASSATRYEYVDQDLYTPFKHAHRWGIIASGQVNYKPWLDTLVKCNFELASNEDFSPDSCGVRLSVAQLIGSVRSELGWRLKQYFSDSDRASSALAQSVSVGAYWERWITGQHRLELGVQYRHDWPNAGSGYFVVMRCDFGRGRGYRDHGPRESPFGDLRSSRLPAAFNNTFELSHTGSSMP